MYMDEMTDIQALRRRCNRLERYSWESMLRNYTREFPKGMVFKMDIESRKILNAILKPRSNLADITFRYNHPFDSPVVIDTVYGDLYYILNDNTDVGLFIGNRQVDDRITYSDVASVHSSTTKKQYVTIKGQNNVTLFIDSKNQFNLDYTCTTRQTIADTA